MEAARKIEEEHDAKMEEKELQKKEQRRTERALQNKSGEWKESDSGLEWIANSRIEDDSVDDDNFPPAPSDRSFDDSAHPAEEEEEKTDFTEGMNK